MVNVSSGSKTDPGEMVSSTNVAWSQAIVGERVGVEVGVGVKEGLGVGWGSKVAVQPLPRVTERPKEAG